MSGLHLVTFIVGYLVGSFFGLTMLLKSVGWGNKA